MKSNKIYLIILMAGLFFAGCEKVLDKENLRAIDPSLAWGDPSAANAYINEIYADLMPEFSTNDGRNSDEATYESDQMPSHLRGTATIDTWDIWEYGAIRKVNVLLKEIDGGTLDAPVKDPIKGQAYFWRAWAYFQMVRAYGGVPLILEPQDPSMGDAIFQTRNKTSECMTQIIKDLEQSLALLPVSWGSNDKGRIDKAAAAAFKGRVLLYYASPQFNPQNDAARWQNAYTANKTAKETCESAGKGMYSDFKNIWYVDNNEPIMSRYYIYPDQVYDERGNRPIRFSNNRTGWDWPSLDLVDAFPMKDGSKYNNSSGYQKFWQNRDNRFYATIAYNGSDYGIKDLVALGTYLWTWRSTQESNFEGPLPSNTSFYRNKSMDKSLDFSNPDKATVPWVEIRYTEVLMNYGEAANEIGKPDEALDVLNRVRERAGILPGSDGKYGITATTKEQIRQAYMDERFVEFAFENKRFWDLRRLRKFDILNNLKYHHGLVVTANVFPAPQHKENIDEVFNDFTLNVVQVDPEPINVLATYYFFGIPKYILDQNSKIEQTKGWNNGTFDPLQ